MNPTPDILTVDVEEWFHGHNYLATMPCESWSRQKQRVGANTDRILDLLERHAVKATFFVLGWTADHHPDLVRRIAAAGHEIGCHSYAHPVVNEMTSAAFLDDLDRALAALARCGVRPRGYRAPSFTITPAVHHYLELLRDRGFSYDCSLFPVRHPRYGQPGSPRTAFLLAGSPPFVVVPMPTWRLCGINLPFSGGGYMRLLPGALYRRLRLAARRQGQPCLVYLHPWELDDFRPATGQGRLLRWRSQAGQRSMACKLTALLRCGNFLTLGSYVDQLLAAGGLPCRTLPLVSTRASGG